MALKDLIASNSALLEEAIEGVIAPYILFDVEEREVIFRPEFASLGNKEKILAYLVALHGWRFVSDDPMPTAVKPAILEARLCIPGGSLRPLLKDLKEKHLLVEKEGSYSIRTANLAAIAREFSSVGAPKQPRRPAPSPSRQNGADKKTADVSGEAKPGKLRRSSGGKGASEVFANWIDEDFFSSARTLADVLARFHDEAIIVPRTSIPKILLTAVRGGKLRRRKSEVGSKTIWIYENKTGVGK